MKILWASAGNVKSALAAARRLVGLRIAESRETLRSGGEDGLYRCHLADGTIVEVTVRHREVALAGYVY